MNRFSTAMNAMLSAIATSTHCVGKAMRPYNERPSVSEWASVKSVICSSKVKASRAMRNSPRMNRM